jgi:hypothetical protein
MQNFKLWLKIGSTDSGGYVKFNPKYIIEGGERGRGVSEFLFKGCNLILLVTQGHVQNFKIIPYLLLGYFCLVGGTEGGTETEDLVDFKGFLSHH